MGTTGKGVFCGRNRPLGSAAGPGPSSPSRGWEGAQGGSQPHGGRAWGNAGAPRLGPPRLKPPIASLCTFQLKMEAQRQPDKPHPSLRSRTPPPARCILQPGQESRGCSRNRSCPCRAPRLCRREQRQPPGLGTRSPFAATARGLIFPVPLRCEELLSHQLLVLPGCELVPSFP